MSCVSGLGTLTFGSLTAKFHSPDGFQVVSATVPAVDCTDDDDTVKTYVAGNLKDFGELTGTIQVLPTSIAELSSLLGTSGTATWTCEIENGSGNGTNATVSGTAILTSVTLNAEENGLVKGPATFKWAGAVTFTNESA